MTLNELEKRLQSFSPKFHIKRYGTSMAAVHYGNEHLFRVPQGEITLYNVTQERTGYNDDLATFANPRGAHRYLYKLRRGVGELSHLLQAGGKITQAQAAQLRGGITKPRRKKND